MTSQDKIDQLEAHNRALVEVALAMREWIDAVPSDTVLPAMPGFDRDWADSIISNSPVDLYRKEQEVIEAAIVYINTFSESPEEYDSTVVLEKHITNLQQARQENK